MVTTRKVAIGEQFRIAGGGFEAPFRGRVATLLGYTRRGWARVRLDDAGPREASISAERDEATGRPIVLLFPDRLQGAEDPSGEGSPPASSRGVGFGAAEPRASADPARRAGSWYNPCAFSAGRSAELGW